MDLYRFDSTSGFRSEMKRLRELEQENDRLKKLVADLSLDKAILEDVKRKL